MFIKRSKYNELIRENMELIHKTIEANNLAIEANIELIEALNVAIRLKEEIKQLRIQIGDLKGWVVKSEK